MIPDGLAETTRSDEGVREFQLHQSVRKFLDRLIPENDVKKPLALV